MRQTIGSASTPARSQTTQTSRQRIVDGCRIALKSAAVACPRNSTCKRMSRSMADVVRPSSSIAGRRGALKRHLAMPYVSFAALLPRQES